jgi:quercetin dioxygenase-like cupin family protein
MATPRSRPGESIDVRPLGAQLPSRKTVALFKSVDLEVIRVVLLAGKSLPPHRVRGEITIQCIEGKIDVVANDTSHLLNAGQLLFLSGNVLHAVTALEDASALVTIVLRT